MDPAGTISDTLINIAIIIDILLILQIFVYKSISQFFPLEGGGVKSRAPFPSGNVMSGKVCQLITHTH